MTEFSKNHNKILKPGLAQWVLGVISRFLVRWKALVLLFNFYYKLLWFWESGSGSPIVWKSGSPIVWTLAAHNHHTKIKYKDKSYKKLQTRYRNYTRISIKEQHALGPVTGLDWPFGKKMCSSRPTRVKKVSCKITGIRRGRPTTTNLDKPCSFIQDSWFT